MAVRRVDVAEPVAAELRRSAGNQAIDIKALDLSDLRSVKAFTDAWEGPLDILVNNAGIMPVPELEKTPQDFELQFGTNFLGHFALTIGLHTALAAANGARVVSVSSTGHLFSPTQASMPIRHGGILAKRASTRPRDHFCRSTIAPRSSWPTMWKEFLPISMPTTEIAALTVWDMACSLSLVPRASIACWWGGSTAGPSH
jgi:NAD(P)-dependent dehydrogenase (short-subunit alcohol dehydrogenase family)